MQFSPVGQSLGSQQYCMRLCVRQRSSSVEASQERRQEGKEERATNRLMQSAPQSDEGEHMQMAGAAALSGFRSP